MACYALRIHKDGLTDDGVDRLRKWCDSCGGSYLVVIETEANRPHFQGYVHSEIKLQTLRVRLKTAFPECVGNNGYSLKTLRKDIESYRRYLLKGTKLSKPEVVMHYGIDLSPEFIESEWKKFWIVRDQIDAHATDVQKAVAHFRSFENVSQADVVEWFLARVVGVKGVNEYKIRNDSISVLAALYSDYRSSVVSRIIGGL